MPIVGLLTQCWRQAILPLRHHKLSPVTSLSSLSSITRPPILSISTLCGPPTPEPCLSEHIRTIFPDEAEEVLEEVSRGRREILDIAPTRDKRKQVQDSRVNKRQKLEDGDVQDAPLPIYATKFSEDVLKAEERRPKKKVAVMIGYSGTGYRGMQFTHDHKTIEGDLFKAFVAAGAISKANADDPKKSSFVRCARTDKGVHAAGNVISLKLIVEDHDIVQKINDNLDPQIRVWGYERTQNSFSAYQLVDSRIYEYLIPTHSFLPPHPSSWLARKCVEWAEKKGETEAWKVRQKEVEGYWEKVDQELIIPILNEYDEEMRPILEKALWLKADNGSSVEDGDERSSAQTAPDPVAAVSLEGPKDESLVQPDTADGSSEPVSEEIATKRDRNKLLTEATKRLRNAYVQARRTYRISEIRKQRLVDTLNLYVGTRNYHNYTVEKTFSDPSAKRVIKSFVVNPEPILIDGTEWLSLKVHGQSFMMHQIRKMVGMASLVVRCGADPERLMATSYGPDNISIPKAPSLGLLLERPIFDSYNSRMAREVDRNPIGFTKYEAEIEEFKTREIYTKIYADEERDNIFGNFFNHVDNFPSETFLFVTSGGVEATQVKDEDARDKDTKVGVAPIASSTAVGAAASGNNNPTDPVVDGNSDADSDVETGDGAGNEG